MARMMSFCANLFPRVSVKTKLLVCILLLSLAPQMIVATAFFSRSRDNLVETTQRDVYSIIKANNELISQQLETVRGATMNILVDRELYNILTNARFENTLDSATVRRGVADVLTKYFLSLDSVMQVDLITEAATYSMNGTTTAQYVGFFGDDIYHRVESANGGLVWLTKKEMAKYQHKEPYMSCARLLNLVYVDWSGIPVPLKQDKRAVIRVQFEDDFFRRRLGVNIENLRDAGYALISKSDGPLVSGGIDSGIIPDDVLNDMFISRSGICSVTGDNGRQYIVCYDMLDRSGWMSVVLFSADALAQELTRGLIGMYLAAIFISAATSVLAAFLAVSLVSGRVRHIRKGIEAIEAGRYDARIHDGSSDEFSSLIGSFNSMAGALHELIDENYKQRISEQAARIQTLTAQLNPHFLYNTLNAINWVALSGDARKTSALIVSLSRILRYTCDSSAGSTIFADDLVWLKQYISLMQARFQGLFTVHWDIPESLLNVSLPKLFLQPLLENAILHGFAGLKQGGEINVRARAADDGDVVCEVEDNGIGMTTDQAKAVLSPGGSVGLWSTHERLRLQCGEGYGFEILSSPNGGCLVRIKVKTDSAASPPARILAI